MCTLCTSQDYANRIYDDRRSNFYDYACAFSFAGGNSTFGGACSRAVREQLAREKANEPTLFYRQPNSYNEYMNAVHSLEATQEPFQVEQRSTFVSDPQRCSNCQPCSIVPCGNGGGSFQVGCCPQQQFQRRMRYNGGAPFKPASALPILDRYQWSQPESLYVFDSEKEYQQAFDGIYNGNIALEAKFNFQNPQEQQRLWYGIKESRPQVAPEPIKADCSECGNVPVPYYRNYLESKYACGCNQRKCTGSCI